MRNKFFSGLLALLFCFTPFLAAVAEDAQPELPTVNSILMEQDGNRLEYPQLTGWPDSRVQQRINDDIILSANITSHMITFASLSADSLWGLQVSYDAYATDHVVSFVIYADGKMPNNRQGHTVTPLTYDLSTGKQLKPAALFADPEAAQQWLEEAAERNLSSEMSNYESSGSILPLPVERFSLDATGITFWYEPEQLTTVSGKPGACRFDYTELQHLLITDGLPADLCAISPRMTADEQHTLVLSTLEEGKLPQLPVTLGDAMTDIIDAYGLSRTPDEFPGGRYFVLEEPIFQNILLISDAMQSSYEGSVLEGIQLRRGAFCGLLVGEATRKEWLLVLGEPQETIEMTENMAYDYNLPTGTCDIYSHAGNTVRFYADENGVLAAVQFERK
ncbi:MAG: hypothetical protein E7320_00340 [Clostridiales bacterium]|nr:hypothetical protein [Clostridiales bacterium]